MITHNLLDEVFLPTHYSSKWAHYEGRNKLTARLVYLAISVFEVCGSCLIEGIVATEIRHSGEGYTIPEMAPKTL